MSLFGLFESRANIENPAVPLTSAAVLDYLGGGMASDAGVHVSETGALNTSAVYRAVSLVSTLGGALPLHTYEEGTKNSLPSALLREPHPDLTPCELWGLSYTHRGLWGNFAAQKIRAGNGEIKHLFPITPSRVRYGRTAPSEVNPSGKVFAVTDDHGVEHAMTSREIFHVPGFGYDGVMGMSPVRAAAQGIGMALAAEKYGAKLFGSGNLLSGILKTEQRLEQPQADALQARWKAKMAGLGSAHDVAVLDSGASFQSLTMPNDEAQLLESRRFQITDLSRFFGVVPFLMYETEKSTSWGTGLEQQATGWVKFDLHPRWLAPTEQRITRELLLPNQYAKYKVEGLLRGDSTARAGFYRIMREVGAFSANDVRELEDMPPIPNGDSYLQPLNMAPLGSENDPDNERTSDASQPAQQ